MKKKALLILGASNDQLFMIKTAHEMNIDTVVVDGNKNAVGLKEAKYSKAIDFSNISEVINYVEELISKGVNVSGVLSMGSDVPHIIAKIAKYFSWVGPSEETAKITTDKFLMKEEFQKADIAIPKYSLVKTENEVFLYWNSWGCDKLIIKPTDCAGSRGVSLISNKDEIKQLFQRAKDVSKSKNVLIEEYIEGIQISTESIIYNGKIFHPGFADRVYDETYSFYPFIMENGGWQPSNIEQKKYDEICKLLENIIKVIKLSKGVIKGDIVYSTKYNKAMVIEVASRLSGGDFSASLVPMSKGINYVKTAITIALGLKPEFNELEAKKSNIVANRYFFLPQGKLEEIKNLEKIKSLKNLKKLEFNYEIGDMIPEIESHGQRIGVFIVSDKNRKLVQKTIDYVYNMVEFRVDKELYSGHPKFYKI